MNNEVKEEDIVLSVHDYNVLINFRNELGIPIKVGSVWVDDPVSFAHATAEEITRAEQIRAEIATAAAVVFARHYPEIQALVREFERRSENYHADIVAKRLIEDGYTLTRTSDKPSD